MTVKASIEQKDTAVSSRRKFGRVSLSEVAWGFAAMQQIADWLEKLGMSEYAERFAENRIDFSVLR